MLKYETDHSNPKKWSPSEYQIKNMVLLYEEGVQLEELSKRFGWSTTAIKRVIVKALKNGVTWKGMR